MLGQLIRDANRCQSPDVALASLAPKIVVAIIDLNLEELEEARRALAVLQWHKTAVKRANHWRQLIVAAQNECLNRQEAAEEKNATPLKV